MLTFTRGQAEQASEHCLDAQAPSLLNPKAQLLLALCLPWPACWAMAMALLKEENSWKACCRR